MRRKGRAGPFGPAVVSGMLALVISAPLFAQTATLMPQDYIAIQQLVSKYAYAIDECTNRGYDYADLYTPDGAFYTSRSGKIMNRFGEAASPIARTCRGRASSTCS